MLRYEPVNQTLVLDNFLLPIAWDKTFLFICINIMLATLFSHKINPKLFIGDRWKFNAQIFGLVPMPRVSLAPLLYNVWMQILMNWRVTFKW